ncbi:hypothetical protein DFH01_08825 [Falsiroseomonas bella]|uniref:Uncharacterized protein n=1 Tax=Falsiroseomonas bella TaxID=2184016 RepID=A0A317FDL4_9PROT|nr:hypothetical protein DFH01_08825 [Falsiroseomonas bella]
MLLGGGVATMLAACGDDEAKARACQEAKAAQRPDAAEICARSTSATSSGSRGYAAPFMYGRTRSSGSSVTRSSVSRGGFGSVGRSSS